MELKFNCEEKDLLLEIINFSVAKAADNFASMAKEKVLLSAPDFKILEQEEISFGFKEFRELNTIVTAEIKGDLQGYALVLFSEEQIELLSKVCLVNLMISAEDRENLKYSLVVETGNILFGTVLSQLSNILRMNIISSKLSIRKLTFGNQLMEVAEDLPYFKSLVFTIHTKFIYSYKALDVPLVLVLDLYSLMKITEAIRSFDIEKFELLKITDSRAF